ncbi:MAG: TonB-dependent receptor [Gemmatimonadetes bacterium]|nr:TonB-dependent receptor [Gemmatimonadota bacterium]
MPTPLSLSPRIALLVCALVAARTANAQKPPAADSVRKARPTQTLAPVSVSATPREAEVIGGTAAVAIRPAELHVSPAPVLADALRETPFVLVRQNSRGENEVSIRGSDSRQAAILLDGLPISLGWDHRVDPSLIPLTGAERMVVVRGLGSLLNGPNSLGGTVEITHDAGAPPTTGRVRAGAGVDQYGATSATLGYGHRVGTWRDGVVALNAGGAHRQRDGFALADGARDATSTRGLRTGTDLRQTDGFASLRWTRVNGRAVSAVVSGYDATKGVPPEEHLAAPRLWRYPYTKRVMAMASANSGLVSTPFGFGSIEAGAGINRGALQIDSYTDRDYQTVQSSEIGRERTATMRVLGTHSLGQATLRASFSSADVRYEETLSPTPTAVYRQTLTSGAAEIEWPVLYHSQIEGGVAYDVARSRETGGRTTAPETFRNAGWRVGLSHEPSPHVRLHASASERSRFPSLRELYSGSLNRFVPNPDLRPETLLGFEGGVTTSRQLAASVSSSLQLLAFRHRLDDAVVRISLSNPSRFKRINRDQIRTQGIEMLGGVTFGAEQARAVTLTGDATLQQIRVVNELAGDAFRHAENNPERRARLELGTPLPQTWRAIVVARYSGRQYCVNPETQREDELSGRLMGDLAVQRDFPRARSRRAGVPRLVVALDNAADVAAYDQCGLPQPGRTFRVMITFR